MWTKNGVTVILYRLLFSISMLTCSLLVLLVMVALLAMTPDFPTIFCYRFKLPSDCVAAILSKWLCRIRPTCFFGLFGSTCYAGRSLVLITRLSKCYRLIWLSSHDRYFFCSVLIVVEGIAWWWYTAQVCTDLQRGDSVSCVFWWMERWFNKAVFFNCCAWLAVFCNVFLLFRMLHLFAICLQAKRGIFWPISPSKKRLYGHSDLITVIQVKVLHVDIHVNLHDQKDVLCTTWQTVKWNKSIIWTKKYIELENNLFKIRTHTDLKHGLQLFVLNAIARQRSEGSV